MRAMLSSMPLIKKIASFGETGIGHYLSSSSPSLSISSSTRANISDITCEMLLDLTLWHPFHLLPEGLPDVCLSNTVTMIKKVFGEIEFVGLDATSTLNTSSSLSCSDGFNGNPNEVELLLNPNQNVLVMPPSENAEGISDVLSNVKDVLGSKAKPCLFHLKLPSSFITSISFKLYNASQSLFPHLRLAINIFMGDCPVHANNNLNCDVNHSTCECGDRLKLTENSLIFIPNACNITPTSSGNFECLINIIICNSVITECMRKMSKVECSFPLKSRRPQRSQVRLVRMSASLYLHSTFNDVMCPSYHPAIPINNDVMGISSMKVHPDWLSKISPDSSIYVQIVT
jgi:hypothetical protein